MSRIVVVGEIMDKAMKLMDNKTKEIEKVSDIREVKPSCDITLIIDFPLDLLWELKNMGVKVFFVGRDKKIFELDDIYIRRWEHE